jgi:formylglycine-generating enzyme required for sulfatase activity
MRVPGCSASFDRGKHLGLWALLLLLFAAIAAWRVSAASPVAAQARTKVNPHDDLTYVWIPPGTFQMGCSPHDSECGYNENPAHSVALTRGFWIGQTPVTQAAYKKVVGANPSRFKGDRLPVETVTWDDANAYCKGVDMRLPSEAEWEYAARGGSPSAHYAPLGQIAWYSANSMGTTHEVGQKQANGYGLYDMLGNVWEWVADWYGPYGTAGAVEPKGSQTGQYHVLRGGSWSSADSLVRVSYRDWYVPGGRGSYYAFGFRCAGG